MLNYILISLFTFNRFYELPEARPPLVLYDRFQFTDEATGLCVEQVITFTESQILLVTESQGE